MGHRAGTRWIPLSNTLRNIQGFTLLEVLMAIVLLAVVVGVSVPFLQGWAEQDHAMSQSEFQSLVAQELAHFELGRSQPMTFDTYTEFSLAHSWECDRVEHPTVQQPTSEMHGEWVVLSDGSNRIIYWTAVETTQGQLP